MDQKQQIIATHDILPPGNSPMEAVTTAINALTIAPSPIFIAIDARRPYPIGDLGPPDWLLVSAGPERPDFLQADWRRVIEAAPRQARVVLLSQGEPSKTPREVVQHVDVTGWSGNRTDHRILAVRV